MLNFKSFDSFVWESALFQLTLNFEFFGVWVFIICSILRLNDFMTLYLVYIIIVISLYIIIVYLLYISVGLMTRDRDSV